MVFKRYFATIYVIQAGVAATTVSKRWGISALKVLST